MLQDRMAALRIRILTGVAVLALGTACGDGKEDGGSSSSSGGSDTPSGGTGASTNAGGSPSDGGSGSGGITSSGGAETGGSSGGSSGQTGGSTGSGASGGTGGFSSGGGPLTGGRPATGGASSAAGSPASGGDSSGGGPSGGNDPGAAGAPATGGAEDGGTVSSAGAGGSGGSGTPVGDIVADPSPGCSGNASPPEGAQTMDVDGTERSYIVSLPDGYDPEIPYPLIFAFHGLGGSAELVSSNRYYFGIEQTGGTPSIFVYPDGLETGNGAGWPNTDGRDVVFFDALLSTMQDNYCVDRARVFSTGHSYGGIMSHTLGCQRAEVLRAIAPVAGAMFGRGECSGPVAAWGAHGDPDDTVDYENGLSAMERVMDVDGCDPNSGTPVEPSEFCTAYRCDVGYPVIWCVHDENHNWPGFAAESIKAFFDGF